MVELSEHQSREISKAHSRLDRQELRIQVLEVKEAGMSEWRANTTDKLDNIQSGIQWISRLIIGGIIAAAISFIIAGGLNGAQ
ncbi:hemolysin XhlA family protein [Pseudooceanicola spongiae]|uniref:Hemolysin XhlA n=1 Tax=Pseudooceanicola spongiae TaxID=2613965 RepID=A0A7L9WKG2_9RHOB|nr:hemolysin XhlA family protein [Pseudooceanicola spongiae]QOL80422.1 hypothetical protein F3W81_06105 [Pseudooceanicola spongiae]